MGEFPPSARIVRFSIFEVDLRAGELRKRGVRLKLQGQPYLLLVSLLKDAGEIVSREDLRAVLWPDGTFTDFDKGLGTAMNKLREVLGDSASTPRFIETVPRRGYRFIAPVEIDSTSEEPLPPPASEPVAKPKTRWPRIAIFGIVITVLVSIIWYTRSLSPTIHSIAVLPLENLSNDPTQEYFSDGMTDELITELSQLNDLRVISRSSVMTYKANRKPIAEIARQLKVDAVVEGTVMRSGDRVRITARLVDTGSDRHLWAKSYEGEISNALALQGQVARAVAGQIRSKLSVQDRPTREVRSEAHEAYLKGRYFWSKRTGADLQKALEFFNQAIELDPDYAQAYSGLADCYALMGDWEYGVMSPADAFPKVKAAAAKALALDDKLGEAHTSLAFSMDSFDWDWASADREYRRAIQLSPSYATAHQWYAWHLVVKGRAAEAISEMRKAQSLDPLSLIIGSDAADLLLVARSTDEAIQQSEKVLELDPNFAVAHYQLGQAYCQKHLYTAAIQELNKAVQLSDSNPTFIAGLAYAYATSGDRGKAMELLKRLEKAQSNSSAPASSASQIAIVHVGLGENDQAMQWLETARNDRFNPSVLLRPCFDPLRRDGRFVDLLHKVGLL
jgi:TolB-like protein/DNA-binding winged helix-turn-helix (wHTH) protein/Flp pilus assembly protein TadD